MEKYISLKQEKESIAEQIEQTVTNGLGYREKDENDSFNQNEFSLQIRLGELERKTSKEGIKSILEFPSLNEQIRALKEISVDLSYLKDYPKNLDLKEINLLLSGYFIGKNRVDHYKNYVLSLGEEEFQEKYKHDYNLEKIINRF